MISLLRRLGLLAMVLAVVAACSGKQGAGSSPWDGDPPETLVISSGGESGIYHSYAQAYAKVIEDRLDVPVVVRESGGSVENLQRLAAGEAHIGFSSVDAADDAISGRGSFGQPLQTKSLARVYDDFVHLVVLADSPVQTVLDLGDHSVSLGATGSGTALIAQRLLETAGVEDSELDERRLGLSASIESLRTGEIDAFFWSGGLGTPGLAELAAEEAIRLVSMEELVEPMRLMYGSSYRPGVVPQGMYGLRSEVVTLAVPNVLVVPQDLPEGAAYALVESLFAEQVRLAEAVPAAALLDRARAIFTNPVDLHEGALRYYRETKE